MSTLHNLISDGDHGIGSDSEVNLYQELFDEACYVYGSICLYLPKEYRTRDVILNEPSGKNFANYYEIPVLVNGRNYTATNNFFSRMAGFAINDEINFVLSKYVFTQITNLDKPKEDDVLYFPKAKQFFTIAQVEFRNSFFKFGNIFAYELICHTTEINNDTFDTGHEEVDETITKAINSKLHIKNDVYKEESIGVVIEEENPFLS